MKENIMPEEEEMAPVAPEVPVTPDVPATEAPAEPAV